MGPLTMTVHKADIVAWLERLAAVYTENRAYLTQLDSPIGDADHGVNMARGFNKVQEKLPDLQPEPLDALLKGVGMTLVSTVGGASGPLYGTFFIQAGRAAAGLDDLNLPALADVFQQGADGVQQRGKAQPGDKTMLDALLPAVDALTAAVEASDELPAALQQATDAAKHGMQATIQMQAKKGRASYLGERSIGHQDPGATSTYLLLKTAKEIWGNIS